MGGLRRWNRTSPSLAWMEHVIGELLRKLDSRRQVLCLRIQHNDKTEIWAIRDNVSLLGFFIALRISLFN